MLLFAASAPAFDGPDGRLTQLSGGTSVSHGCVTDDGSGGACLDGRALASLAGIDVAVSHDGGQLYVAGGSGIAILQRDFADGALVQSFGPDGCVTSSGVADGFPCVADPGLGSSYGVVVSPDGANVYATSQANDSVTSFSRQPFTGALTPIGSLTGRALNGPRAIGISRDGRNVYVTSDGSNAVASLTRNPNGTLTQIAGTAGCVSDDGNSNDGPNTCRDGNDTVLSATAEMPLDVSPDGANVYVGGNNGLLGFSRGVDGSLTEAQCLGGPGPPAGCTAAVGLDDPTGVAVAPDGRHLYATSATLNSIAYFSRSGGVLGAPGGCLSEGGSACPGANTLHGMRGPAGLALSPDGSSLYVAPGAGAGASRALAAFAIDAAGGGPVQLAGTAACIAETPGTPSGTAGCDDGKALTGSLGVVVAPDGSDVYSAAISPTDGLASFARTDPPDTAISAAPRARTKHRRVRFSFAATKPGAFFYCKLDKAPFGVCASPFRAPKLKRGAHIFQVYAVGASGQADPTPAVYRFRIGKDGSQERAGRHHKHGKRRGHRGKQRKP
jgi:DNA-binding beta-propeller fold protein YncE